MNQISKFLIAITVIMSCYTNIFSQKIEYSTKSKSAIKFYETSMQSYNLLEYQAAINDLNKALEIDNKFIEAYMLLGDIYSELRNYKESVNAFQKGININPNYNPIHYLYIAKNALFGGMYKEAKAYLDTLRSYNPNQGTSQRIDYFNKYIDFGIKSVDNPVPFNPINLGDSVNSEFNEYFPCITADEQIILFTRRLNVTNCPFPLQEDFYMSKKINNIWSKASSIGRPINTTCENEGAPSLSPDGNILIYTACDDIYGSYGNDKKGYGSCDLFFSRRIGNIWSAPVNMGSPINTGAWESQPSYASDGKTIYFASGRKGGIGGYDLWKSELTPEGYWGQPVNLGNKINTPGHEEGVFIHPDNQTLYFSSDGHMGLGGLDLFVSKKDASGEWGEPMNLGYPINTWHDETGIIVSASGETAYFSSDREGTFGGLDLYSFDLYDKARPNKVTYVKGKVYDGETKKGTSAKFELIDLETGEVVVESSSNNGNGEFLVCLPVNKDYALNVSKDNYLFYSENFSLTDKGSKTEAFKMDIPLLPIKENMTVVLKNIFFETASYDLKPESKVELKRLIDFMKKNPSISILISGHTDNVGDDKSNLILSENRAKTVVDYLIANSIASARLKYKGFGESTAVATNDTEQGRALNRRTEFTIIGK